MEINHVSTEQTAATATVTERPLSQMKPQLEALNVHVKEEEEVLSKVGAKKAVDSFNNILSTMNSHLKYNFHEQLNEYYVAIVDSRTNEVVREIPPKKLLDMVATMYKQLGIIVDDRI